MESLVLTARVVWEDSKYVARTDTLPLEGAGDTVREAQDQLVHAVRSWIETGDGAGRLEQALPRLASPESRRRPNCNWSLWNSDGAN